MGRTCFLIELVVMMDGDDDGCDAVAAGTRNSNVEASLVGPPTFSWLHQSTLALIRIWGDARRHPIPHDVELKLDNQPLALITWMEYKKTRFASSSPSSSSEW